MSELMWCPRCRSRRLVVAPAPIVNRECALCPDPGCGWHSEPIPDATAVWSEHLGGYSLVLECPECRSLLTRGEMKFNLDRHALVSMSGIGDLYHGVDMPWESFCPRCGRYLHGTLRLKWDGSHLVQGGVA